MEKDDVELIQRTLSADEAAFSTLIKKTPKRRSRARMAQSQRFPYR